MQQLSNDTASWNIIDPPLPVPLFYNSSVYDTLSDGINKLIDLNNPITPISIDHFSSLPTKTTVSIGINTPNYWAFALIFFPIFTIFGNVLVVVSVYREKSLHTITNYFVVSLAISDITVAAVVMPFAIYLEFNRVWELSERLCDFWVASDCMACTASILNLVAIAVDRYIAVTKPLKYARHKNSKRVAIMIVIVWFVSFFIALPIVSGVNKSDVPAYPRVRDQCAFFNNKFLIFSSLGSFFIPCIIIFAIYYRIFMVIMARARKNRKQWRPKTAIESAAAQHRSNADTLLTSLLQNQPSTNHIAIMNDKSVNTTSSILNKPQTIINPSVPLSNTNNNNNIECNTLMIQLSAPALAPQAHPSINVMSSSGDQVDDDERDDIALFIHDEQKRSNNNTNNTSNHRYQEHENRIEILPPTPIASNIKSNKSASFKTTTHSSQTENDHDDYHYPTKHFKTRLKTNSDAHTTTITTNTTQPTNNKNAKRKAYSRMKKERKATQTLIIVLICFLVCWLPFFVLNNLVNAIVKLSKKSETLLIHDFTLSLCVWLGYVNSFLNPIIYTIFNLEFRKAFAKILFSPCRLSTNSSS
ncbi:unnamed protein product [Rotaria magnacalcarata]|uniref:G-protein coupled receptors family 1 profile domain-containing protein n=2 Tax=Rotaria magnacalcarata TaxID=392030 RepID=A0A819JE90_9BILA|nr:unnamed protein product [Rotaria magnacalcarata]CAF2081203.1 unnamed protein product [Rotaria magnacalcarata]CAF3929258.1 unnamed protein product [Rotaria magnacalcarata]